MAKDNSSVAWDCQLNAIHRGNSLIYSLAFPSSWWGTNKLYSLPLLCSFSHLEAVLACPEVTLWQLFLSQQVRHCRAVSVPSARSQDRSVPPGPGRWEKCCVPGTSMNCHLEPASQHPVPTFRLRCKALGLAVQIQEVCATCGSEAVFDPFIMEPKALNQISQSLFPTKPGKTGEDFGGGKGGGILCTSSDWNQWKLF